MSPPGHQSYVGRAGDGILVSHVIFILISALFSAVLSVDEISKPVQYQYLPSVQQRPFCRCHPGEIFSHNHFFLLFGENLFRNFYLLAKLMLPTNGRKSSLLNPQVENIVPSQVSCVG